MYEVACEKSVYIVIKPLQLFRSKFGIDCLDDGPQSKVVNNKFKKIEKCEFLPILISSGFEKPEQNRTGLLKY